MIIKKIIYQHRRDFTAIYKCEGCEHETEMDGYDDHFFHNEVIPNRKCSSCNKSSNDLGVGIQPREPKYPSWVQI